MLCHRANHPRWLGSALALLVLGGAGGAAADSLFDPPVPYFSGGLPCDVAAADVNGDLWADLIVANEGAHSVSVLLNAGDGTFLSATPFPVAGAPLAVAVAEMNADPFPDIIASNSTTNNVSVLINLGDGTFAAAADYPCGAAPWGIVAADLNGDQAADVAVVNHDADSFSVLLNNGDGTLSLSGLFAAGGAYISPAWLTTGHFNNDEHLDIAVTKNYHNLYFNAGYVQIYFNDGAGSFTSTQTFETGRTATTPMTADFDGDQDVDLAVSGFVNNSYRISVLLNDGAGTFASPSYYFAGAGGRATAGDFDADGDVDVLVSEADVYASSFSVVLNNGDATFADPFTVSVGSDPRGMTGADIDRDGDRDAAVAVQGEHTVAVAINLTDPVAAAPREAPSALRTSVQLLGNVPNPFGRSTTVRYALPHAAPVTLEVLDLQGRRVRVLAAGVQGPGIIAASWDGRDARGSALSSGVYLYRLRAGAFVEERSMLLMR